MPAIVARRSALPILGRQRRDQYRHGRRNQGKQSPGSPPLNGFLISGSPQRPPRCTTPGRRWRLAGQLAGRGSQASVAARDFRGRRPRGLAWITQYHRTITECRQEVAWREGNDLPPRRERICSPYDTDARYATKRSASCGSLTRCPDGVANLEYHTVFRGSRAPRMPSSVRLRSWVLVLVVSFSGTVFGYPRYRNQGRSNLVPAGGAIVAGTTG